jgi:hypothetical protein
MTSVVDEILFAFANERDTNGNEYKLRYPPSQPGNRRFAEQVTSMFPTRLINVAHSRSDADVTAAMCDRAHISQWRARYAVLPSNTEALVAAWLRAQLAVAANAQNAADARQQALASAACIAFASRSTIRLAPRIVRWNDIAFAAWRTTEKCGKPRLVPLLFECVSVAEYETMAAVLPRANEWTQYEAIDELFDQLGMPPYSRKGNLPRLLLVALMDRATDGQRLAPLMAKLDRGRADLFNLVLGHMSRSYLLWTYMGLLIKDEDDPAVARAAPAAPAVPDVVEAAVVAAKNKEIAELRAELAELRLRLSIRESSVGVVAPAAAAVPPVSPPYSLSSSAARARARRHCAPRTKIVHRVIEHW